MKKRIGSYPRVRIEGDGRTVVSQAGGVLLVETVRKAGLDTAISAALTPWRKARAVHDPGKVLLDAALAVALSGDCLDRTAQNRIWLEIVQIALDLLAWMPMLALTGEARLWEPRRLRLRLFTTAGQLVTTGRRRILRLARHWPWTGHIIAALDRLTQLPDPG
ncbi:transposase [Streptomyces sp. NPDC060000]|uniref:transposase n=1 Tax=Streptomyces sp. NPDC060000 TaxID=3347031 RepID=UPI0036A77EBE